MAAPPLTRGAGSLEVPPHPEGARLGEAAATRAARLAALLREEGAYAVAQLTDRLTRDELLALAIAAAAMLPADVDPDKALAWVDLPPQHWPDAVVETEAARAFRGADDHVARLGFVERERRLREQARPGRRGIRAVPA